MILDLSQPLLCFLLQYGGLGLVFAAGIGAGWRLGFLGFERGARRRNLAWMLFGYVFYAALHGIFTFHLSPVGG